MGDLTITAAQVVPLAAGNVVTGILGEALTAGEVVYVKVADSKLWKADADALASAAAVGIMVCDGAAEQKGAYQAADTLVLGAGAGPTQGQTYVVSGTAGKIALESDLTTGDYVTILGVGDAANGIKLDIRPSAIAHA